MRVVIEWFGETGAPLRTETLHDVAPVAMVPVVRDHARRQFEQPDNTAAVAVATVVDTDSHEYLRVTPAIMPLGRFVVTNATQGNWGNGSEF